MGGGAPLAGRIALVTGGTRGVGKGVALGLAEAGATVIVTGRTLSPGGAPWPGSIEETVAEAEALGGKAIGIACDHADDASVTSLFDRIAADLGGLDVLVNNVFAAPATMPVNIPFWEYPMDVWDMLHGVGLRSHFLATRLAMPLLLRSDRGLVVNTSSGGGVRYTFNVAFGVQKAGVDRLARDMAHDLQPHGIAAVSLWPGYIKSEKLAAQPERVPPALAKLIAERGETPRFAGRAVAALAGDAQVMRRSGRILLVSELAQEYGFTDIDGKVPPPPSREPTPLPVFEARKAPAVTATT